MEVFDVLGCRFRRDGKRGAREGEDAQESTGKLVA